MNQFRTLMYLQELEREEIKLHEDLKSLPQRIRLNQLKKEIEKEQSYLKNEKEILDLNRKKLRDLELTVAKDRAELDLLSQRLFSGEITNLKELESTDSKRKSLEEQIKELEDLVIAQMETLDQEKKRLQELNQNLKYKKEEFKVTLEEYNEVQEELKDQLGSIPKEKLKLESQIDKKIMTDYNEKKSKYANNYVVEIKNQTCQGCHVTLPFELIKRLRTEKAVRCDKCGRILI